MERTILHVDCNNFFASVECMLHPELKGKPIAVCGDVEERHGIVLAKNYTAKKFGVTTGEAVWQAKQKCRDLVIVPPHYDEYMKISKAAREIYGSYTDKVEPFGMDECWCDVSGGKYRKTDGVLIANEIRNRVKSELGVTVSVGVSFNKIFAKLGSDMKKPDAVTEIPETTFKEKIWDLPAGDMLGVGRATEKKLSSYGIRTIGDIATWPVYFFERILGKCGVQIWRFANGLDNSPVECRDYEMLDKSCGHGITTLQDLISPVEVWNIQTVELLMSIATLGVVIAQLVSILFGWSCLPTNARFTGFCTGMLGDLIFLLSVLCMKDSWRAGITDQEYTELVTSGIYRFSRNPAFLGFDFMYIGVMLMYCNLLTVPLTVFAIVMLHLQILQEERYLDETFGEAYREYKRHTFRYLGWR